MFANCIRFVFFAVDPVFSAQVFPYPVARVLSTVTFAMGFCTSILISFFWVESTKSASINFLVRLKIPFLVSTAILIGTDLASSIAQGVFYAPATVTTIIAGSVLALTSFVVGLLFLFAGRRLTNAHRAFDVHSRGIRRITRWIMVSVAAILLFTVAIVMASTSWFFDPIWYCIITWIIYFSLNVTSIAQVYVFFVHSRNPDSTKARNFRVRVHITQMHRRWSQNFTMDPRLGKRIYTSRRNVPL